MLGRLKQLLLDVQNASKLIREYVGPYHVFTKDFDVEIDASNLDDVVPPVERYASDAEESRLAYTSAIEQHRADIIGCLDREKARVLARATRSSLDDTTATLLLDLSGSARGEGVSLIAATADIASYFMSSLDISVEILGFTTVSWKGGRPKQQWVDQGRRQEPGRLCELLHIVFAEAGKRTPALRNPALREIFRPGLLKENVDGEAVEWAVGRLRHQEKPKKLLIVISDGSPIDDWTIHANGGRFLERHLREVLAWIEDEGDICVCGIGIRQDTSRYYSRHARIDDFDEIAPAVCDFLGRELLSFSASAADP